MSHYRVTWSDALSAHEEALRTGGRRATLDRGLIESAIARPYWHRSIAQKAAALFEAVAQNHGFCDGNKRTAIILTSVLIDRSGYQLRLDLGRRRTDDEKAAIMKALVKAVVVHALTLEELVAWFRARLQAKPRR